MAVDPLASSYYELKFENAFLRAEGEVFQQLFERVMERAHPGDFTRIQPWGNAGDKKCDGYLASEKMVFGCYGPKDFKPLPRAIAKVKTDHAGALVKWKGYMSAWTFVHNDHGGLPADLKQTLEDLKPVDLTVVVTDWGYPELVLKLRRLNQLDLMALFGAAPMSRDVFWLRQDDLRKVLTALAGALSMPPQAGDLRPVPAGKMEHNQLSIAARALLTAGMRVSDQVGKFFDHWQPGLGDRISLAFSQRYRELRAENLLPDEILWRLYEFAGNNTAENPGEQVAALAVVAFLFEACDIFERPPLELA